MPQPWENDAVVGQPASPRAQSAPSPQSRSVFIPAPGAAEEQARKAREEARSNESLNNDATRIGLSQEDNARANRSEKFGNASTLRKEFRALPEYRNYETVIRQFTSALKTDATATGDQALITAYAKMLDPGSVVRDQEFNNVAGGDSTLGQAYARLAKELGLDESGMLRPEVRQRVRNEMLNLTANYRKAYETARSDYTASAERNGLSIDDVVGTHLGTPFRDEIAKNWKSDAQTGSTALQVAEGDTASSDQDIAIARKLQDKWNGGASPEEMNALSVELTGKPLSDDGMKTLRENIGGRVDIVPGSSGANTGAEITGGFGGDIKSALAGSVRGYFANMPEELGSFLGIDPAKMQAALDAYQEKNPVANFIGETAGGLLSPASKIIKGGKVAQIGSDAAYGGIYGAGEGDENATMGERAIGAAVGGATGAAASYAGQKLFGPKAAQVAEDVPAITPSPGADPASGTSERFVRSYQGTDYPVEVLERGVRDAEGNVWAKVRGETGEIGYVPDAEVIARPAPTAPPTVSPAAKVGEEATKVAGDEITPEVGADEAKQIAELARIAVGRGPGTAKAKRELAKMAQANPEAKAAAERLGVDLPPDVLSDSAQLQSLTGMARSQVGSDAETAWKGKVKEVAAKADEALGSLGATTDLAQASDDVFKRLESSMESLQRQGDELRTEVDEAIDVREPVDAASLQNAVGTLINDLGGLESAKKAMTGEERKLLAMLGEGETANKPTYAYLNRLRDQIGKALHKNEGPWADVPRANLAKYYAALADDQIAHIETVAGTEIADKMRGSNTLFKKMYDARADMQEVFGKGLDKSLTPLLNRALTQGGKGDVAALKKLITRIPADMRGPLLASGLLAQAQGKGAQGGFSFANYAKSYRGLRDNKPVYQEFAKALGPGGDRILADLYAISRRMVDADGNVLRTGKANQALLALNAERLLSKVMKSTAARIVGTVAGGVAGGPVGGGLAMATQEMLSRGSNSARSDKLHALLSSDAFRGLMERTASGDGVDGALNRLAGSKVLRDYLPKSVTDPKEWLRSAMAVGATSALPEPPKVETAR